MPTSLANATRPATPPPDDAVVAELERLWEHSPGRPAEPASAVRPWGAGASATLAKAIVVGWAAFFVAVFVAAPPAEESVQAPAWVTAASTAILFAVLGAAVVATILPRVALSASAFAAALGVPVGVACGASEHHAGAWWMVETGAFAALFAASAACLALRPRS